VADNKLWLERILSSWNDQLVLFRQGKGADPSFLTAISNSSQLMSYNRTVAAVTSRVGAGVSKKRDNERAQSDSNAATDGANRTKGSGSKKQRADGSGRGGGGGGGSGGGGGGGSGGGGNKPTGNGQGPNIKVESKGGGKGKIGVDECWPNRPRPLPKDAFLQAKSLCEQHYPQHCRFWLIYETGCTSANCKKTHAKPADFDDKIVKCVKCE
jgi:hypothetical protein